MPSHYFKAMAFNVARCAALLLAAGALQAGASEPIDPGEAPVIGEVVIAKQNIFDLANEKENNWLYRLANRLHIVTRDDVIEQQLLFAPGDVYDERRLEESERILRRNRYFFDASVTPLHQPDGTVDVEVWTKDIWSLTPDFSFTRNGGETRWGFGLEENNLLGWGSSVRLKRVEGIDRDSNRFEYRDTNLGRSWTQFRVRVEDNSDGRQQLLSVIRPFHALEARWTAGVTMFDDDRRTALWSLGDEAAVFRHERQFFNAFGGWSDGLKNGWVRRWTAGFIYDDNVFSERPEDELPSVVPSDRKLSYPYIGFELLEDNFETASNTNRMGRTEDFFIGTRLAATLGWSDDAFGADRDALVFSTTLNQGFGSISKTALFLGAQLSGRHEDGQMANMLTGLSGRFFHRQSEKWLFSATVEGIAGDNLDLDTRVQLGGNNGLRGYPVRYQSGDSRLLFSVEQRYFTDWYPFRLFRVGGAVFADVGRSWGQNPVGEQNQGWLKDVGFGFRFAPTRFSTDKIVHLDFAFPLDGDDSIDSVQVILEAKRSF